MKPRVQISLLLVGALLWAAAYLLMPQRLPLADNASPQRYIGALTGGLGAAICFVVGLAILSPLAVRYLLWSLRRLTRLLLDWA